MSDRDRERAKEWAAQVYGDSIHAACGEAGYLAGLAACRAEPLVWTSEPPTVPGWYWWTNPRHEYPPLMERYEMTRVRLVDYERSEFHGQLVCDTPCTVRVATRGGAWAGPIPPPQEPPR